MEKKSRSEFLARFRREADAIASLDHINILPIYEYGEQGDIAYLVMPYVTGGTLRDVLEKHGMLTLEESVLIIGQAADGLDNAHTHGIIHRDLKPANMLFHADGRVLLADFGLAKVLRDFKDQDAAQSGSPLTSTGTIVGTPEYLSPEQGTGMALDHRSDVYSLGIVLYQMLTGRVPFTGTSPVAVAIKHAMEEPPPITRLNPDLPASIEAVVMKALAKDPAQRFASVGEMAEALTVAASSHLEKPLHTAPRTPTARIAAVRLFNNDTLPEIENRGTYDAPTEASTSPVASPQSPAKPPAAAKIPAGPHDAPTEEAPRVLPQKTPVQASEEVSETSPTLTPMVLAQRAKVEEVSPSPQVRIKPVTEADSVHRGPERVARQGCQSVSMMLLGSFLTLLVVVGLFAYYLYWMPKGTPSTPGTKVTVTAAATATATVQQTTKPLKLPGARIAAGPLLYGTDLPGPKCDVRGGQWKTIGTAQVNCGKDAVQLGNSASGSSGIVLNTLPQNKPLPDNYLIQVQVDMNVSHGPFSILFRSQSSSPQAGYEYLIDPSGSWRFNGYDNGVPNQLASLGLRTPLKGLVTINVQVVGDTFHLYVDGVSEGHGQSGSYKKGGAGLAVTSGSNVAFKNFAIYALP
jgi:serine/threonine protein kinase